jgi:hypothetical protein
MITGVLEQKTAKLSTLARVVLRQYLPVVIRRHVKYIAYAVSKIPYRVHCRTSSVQHNAPSPRSFYIVLLCSSKVACPVANVVRVSHTCHFLMPQQKTVSKQCTFPERE